MTSLGIEVNASVLVRCEELIDAYGADDLERVTELARQMIDSPVEPIIALTLLAHGALRHAAELRGIRTDVLTSALITALGRGVVLDG